MIRAANTINEKGAKLTFHWVPGHTDLTGNEKADEMAKTGAYKMPITYQTSYAMLGLQVKQLAIDEWYRKLEKHCINNPNSNNHYSYCYGLDPLDQGYATGFIILPLDYKSCRFAMLPRYPPLGVVIRWHVCISVDS